MKNSNIQVQILGDDVRIANINYSFWDRLKLLILFWKPGAITLKNPSINIGGKSYKITKREPTPITKIPKPPKGKPKKKPKRKKK